MARPPEYERLSDFTDYAVNNPSAPYNPSDHDAELDALLLSVNQTISFLNGITRSDGKLLNGSVTVDTLADSLYAFLTAIRQPSQYVGYWESGKTFVFADVITDGVITYFCIVPHTSTVLATDVDNGKWVAFGVSPSVVNGAPAAQAAASAAVAAQLAAENAQTAAELAESNAETAETNAQGFANSASASASAAQTAENNAVLAETNAEAAQAAAEAAAASVPNLPFLDTQEFVKGSIDETKRLRFEVDGFTTGTTRIMTPPNQNTNLAGTNVKQTYTAQQVPMKGTLTDGANIDWNADTNGQIVTVTTAASRTFNAPTNIQEDALYILRINTGGFTHSWNAAYKWPNGTPPSGLAGKCIFTFIGGASNTLEYTGYQVNLS